jgi:hypothetical protein
MIESPEWMAAFTAVRQLFEKAFEKCGLDDLEASSGDLSSTKCPVLPPHRRTLTSLSLRYGCLSCWFARAARKAHRAPADRYGRALSTVDLRPEENYLNGRMGYHF